MDKILLLVKLSENEKRLIITILLVLIILFVIIGLIVSLIRRLLIKYARGIDTYVAEMLQYQILTKPRHIRKYVWVRESKLLFKKLIIPLAVFVGASIGFVIYASVNKITASHFFNQLKLLGIDLYWPTNKFFGLKIICDWPDVIRTPEFHIASFYIYFYALATIVLGFMLLRRTMIFMARIYRSRKKSKEVFTKNLDNMHFDSH